MKSKKAETISNELRKLFGPDMPDSEINRITLNTLNNFRKDIFDTWSFSKLNKKNIDEFGYLDGKENLDRALEKGKGAIIAVSHFGLWKSILPVLGYAGYKVTQVAKNPLDFTSEKSSFVNNKIMQMEFESEKSLPVKFFYLGKFLRPIYSALANNEIVVISFDGVRGAKRVPAKLFEREVFFSIGPAALALESGAPLIPVFMIRDKNERHRIKFGVEIPLPEYDNKALMFNEVINNYADILKDYVAEYPSHYAMFMYIALMHYQDGDPQVFI